MKKKTKSILLIIQIFMLFLCVFSITTKAAVIAEEVNDKQNVKENNYLNEIKTKEKEFNEFEIETLREENVKHFRLQDGTYRGVSYNKPVHRLDNDKWIDINNTLILENDIYITNDGFTSFSRRANSNIPFFNYDDKISLSFLNQLNGNARIEVTNGIYDEILKNRDDFDELSKININSKIKYYNLCDGLDVEFILDSTTIIVNLDIDTLKFNEQDMNFFLETQNFEIKKEDKYLKFYNSKTNNLEYEILMPFEFTKDTNLTSESLCDFNKVDRNEYKISLSKELFKNHNEVINGITVSNQSQFRQMVFVASALSTGSIENNVSYDSYVSSSTPTTNYGTSSKMIVSKNDTDYALIKINKPSIPVGSTINTAYMRIPYYFTENSINFINLGAYEITGSWTEYGVNWNNKPLVSQSRLSIAFARATATSSSPSYVNFRVTDLAKEWYSGEKENKGIAVKYVNGNENSVILKTWESNSERSVLTINYTIGDLIIKDGTYFIKNGELNKYVQVDDGDSGNDYNTEGAILELWTGTGVNFQKWNFVYLHNGYYKIVSYKSGKVIAVESGNENSSNDALVQQTYNGSHRQQWSVQTSTNGMYIIKARSSEPYTTNRVMCAGDGIGGNGRNVEQREYDDNSYYKDEWIIENIQTEVRLLAYKERNVPRNEYFNETKNIISAERTSDILSNFYSSCTDELMIHYFKSCSLLFIHTHGFQNGILTGSGYLESSELASVNLSNLELVFLLTCETGLGGYSQTRVDTNSPINIVERLICCGAETVVGFKEITYVDDCNKLVPDFARKTMVEGCSVKDAIMLIDYANYIQDMSLIAVIGGNENNYIN